MPQAHQLSAIMFTDIAGYTALMGEDEQKAFDVLNRSRQIQKPLIDQYHGRWLKEMGDGVLASFSSASDAVYCARAIQQQCRHEADLRLRIGIHLGDVVFEGNDVFGDGVNIAARLQAAAPVGDIWISEPVQSNVSNKKDIATEFVRTETLKHVKDPVRIYRVALDGAPTAHRAAPVISIRKPAKSTRLVLIAAIALVLLLSGYFVYSRFVKEGTGRAAGNSIAVLYFNNMSTDPEQEYFSDGITEEIIAHLARIDGLRVISRTSVLPYKDKPANLKKIAGELNVSTVLEGSVRKSGDAIRVTAQLINARTDEHIWVETFDRQLKDIFTLQSDIARSIARKFEVEISPEADAKISRLPTASVEAYDNFQKGIYFLYKKYLVTHQQEDFDKAKKHFERAIQLDPGYAEPYAGLAELYDELRNYNVKAFPDSLLQLKVQLARKALQLNPHSSYTNTAMVWALLHHPERNFDSSYFYAKRAFSLNPTDPLMIYNLSGLLTKELGLFAPVIPLTLHAIKRDPLDPALYALLGEQYACLGKYPEARSAFRTSLELVNDQFYQEATVLYWLVYFGDYEEVERRLKTRDERHDGVRSYLYAARNEWDKVKPQHRDYILVQLAAHPNQVLKEVLKRLEEQIDKGNNRAVFSYDFLSTGYYFDVYRSDADYQRILAKAKKNHDRYLSKYGRIEIPE